MESIVNQVHKSLLKKGKTLAVAESCTGGIVSSMLTQLPGSSAYFLLGVVTYSNQAKQSILRIPSKLITTKGAVSREVAQKMAQSVRLVSGADFGIGITGVAGPSGGTKRKPKGTVFIAVSQEKTSSKLGFLESCLVKKSKIPHLYIPSLGTGIFEHKDKTIVKKLLFKGARPSIRMQAAIKSLELLYENIHRHRNT